MLFCFIIIVVVQSNFLTGIGLKKGDIVALNMENRPEYLTTWLGIAKAGGASAFINCNLKGSFQRSS